MKINLPRVPLKLDKTFAPAVLYFDKFEKEVKETNDYETLVIVVERMDNLSEKYETVIYNEKENKLEENLFYLERLVKTLLWVYGGYKISIVGPLYVKDELIKIFNTKRLFDKEFMERIYVEKFQIVNLDEVTEINQH